MYYIPTGCTINNKNGDEYQYSVVVNSEQVDELLYHMNYIKICKTNNRTLGINFLVSQNSKILPKLSKIYIFWIM